MSLQGRGSLYVLYGQLPSTLGTRDKVEKWLQHLLLFPELPAGSSRSRKGSYLTLATHGGYVVYLISLGKPTPLEDVWGQIFMPMKTSPQGSAPPPHSPWKLWDFLNTVQFLSKSVWL